MFYQHSQRNFDLCVQSHNMIRRNILPPSGEVSHKNCKLHLRLTTAKQFVETRGDTINIPLSTQYKAVRKWNSDISCQTQHNSSRQKEILPIVKWSYPSEIHKIQKLKLYEALHHVTCENRAIAVCATFWNAPRCVLDKQNSTQSVGPTR